MLGAGSFCPDLTCKSAEYGVSRCIEPDASAASSANLFSDNANALSGQYFQGDVDIFQADVIFYAVCFDDLCPAENLWTIVSGFGIPLYKGIGYIILSRQYELANHSYFPNGDLLCLNFPYCSYRKFSSGD